MRQVSFCPPLAFLFALLSACSGYKELPLLPFADRVEVGQLKSDLVVGTISDPELVARLLELANLQRQKPWSSFQFVHGRCTMSLTFFSGSKRLGYIALEGGSFFTNGTSGQAQRNPSPHELQAFFSLVPDALRPVALKTVDCKPS